MPSDPITARDEVFELFTTGFNGGLPEVQCEVRYQGRIINAKPRAFWVRISMQQVLSGENGFVLTDEVDGASPASFETSGLVMVQVFAPINERDAFHKGDLLARKARDIFRRAATASGVWFRNARYNELPFRENDTEYRWNVVVEYEYDERK